MSRFKLCFVFDESGDYKPVPYSKLVDDEGERRKEYAENYFLPFNGYLLEVSHEDYLDYYQVKNHHDYLKRESGKVGEILPLDNANVRALCEDVAEKVVSDAMIESLYKAIALLSRDEQLLIRMYYFDEQTEQHCAEIFKVTQSTINRRRNRTLAKLRKILEV